MQTPREVIHNTIAFKGPDRLGYEFPARFGSDFAGVGVHPSPDSRPWGVSGTDEWGAVWENIGVSKLGEVKKVPLESWDDWPKLKIPDIREPRRFEGVKGARERAGDKYLLGNGVSLYERAHFVRGLQNAWTDIYTNPDELCRLLDIFVDMNLYILDQYAKEEVDGFIFCDDWGLQDKLMISPAKWREFWKPRYTKVYTRAHEYGIQTMLHSCGCISEIMEDLIEAGLDVFQLDQQTNMGLKMLGEKFGGRATFFCPVDIQSVMPGGDEAKIRAYCRELIEAFASEKGGFIPKWYSDPVGVGHTEEAIDAMCDEFMKLSKEMYNGLSSPSTN